MRMLLLTVAMFAMCVLCMAQPTTHYYVNIENAANGVASGTMKAYINNWQHPVAETTLIFIENIYYNSGEMVGRYRSRDPLNESTQSNPVTIKCHAKRPWGGGWLTGYSEQTFTGGSLTQLPTIHLQIPTILPPDVPNPK